MTKFYCRKVIEWLSKPQRDLVPGTEDELEP